MNIKKKEKKKVLVSQIKEDLLNCEMVIVANYLALKANEVNRLRFQIYKYLGKVRVAKSSLLCLAMQETLHCVLDSYCKNSVLLVLAKTNLVEILSVLFEFCKSNDKLLIQGGSISGETFSTIKLYDISLLGSTDVLKQQFLYGLCQSAVLFAQVLRQPIVNLVTILHKKSKQQ